MKTLYELKNLLEEEIKDIVKKETISAQELDHAYKMVDIIKDICEIDSKEKESMNGYSETGRRSYNMMPRDYYEDGSSYGDGNYTARVDGEYSNERRMRDSKGRYSSRDNRNNNGNSRDGNKEMMISKLEKMMDSATSENERSAILQCIEKLED